MDPNFWLALVAQLPIVAAIVIGLNRGWLIVGSSYRIERSDWKANNDFLVGLLNAAVTERKESEARVALAVETTRVATELMKRAIDLNEALLEELRRK